MKQTISFGSKIICIIDYSATPLLQEDGSPCKVEDLIVTTVNFNNVQLLKPVGEGHYQSILLTSSEVKRIALTIRNIEENAPMLDEAEYAEYLSGL